MLILFAGCMYEQAAFCCAAMNAAEMLVVGHISPAQHISKGAQLLHLFLRAGSSSLHAGLQEFSFHAVPRRSATSAQQLPPALP
jgi:hypothetical protein